MADNPQVEVEISSVSGSPTDVRDITGTVSLPTGASTLTEQQTQSTRLGDVTESAPGTDTASSGLNGRLQRIAQRLTSVFTAQSDGTQQTKIRGATDGTLIGNVGDALKTVTRDETLPTYSASIKNLVAASAATDIFVISGSSTKIIKISQIIFSATKQNSGLVDIAAIKRSTLDSGGTSTTLTGVPHDSGNAAATAVVRGYTANPTLGTSVGEMFSQKFFIPSANSASAGQLSTITFNNTVGQPVTLNNVNDSFALNLNGQTLAGNDFSIFVVWTEE